MLANNYHIIDIHAHLGKYFQFRINHWDAGEVLQKADELGIAQICVSHTYGLCYDASEGNTLTLQAALNFPGRILAGGVLDPREPDEKIAEEFFRCNAQVTMWNELHPALHRYPLNGPGYRTILDLIDTSPKPVLFHTDESDRYSKPEFLLEVIPNYPDIPFIIGHSGNVIGGFEKAMNIAAKFDNAFLDSTFSRNYWGIMEKMIDTVGAEKILFGSDMPFLNGSAQVGKLLSAQITDRQKELIFRENALKLLKMDRWQG